MATIEHIGKIAIGTEDQNNLEKAQDILKDLCEMVDEEFSGDCDIYINNINGESSYPTLRSIYKLSNYLCGRIEKE